MTSPGNLSLGPGLLYVGELGTPEPAGLDSAVDPAWKPIGYTDAGSTFSYALSSDPVEVAESNDPLYFKVTGRNGSIAFAMAENTVRNLALAFNGGHVEATPDGGLSYEPPEPGEEVRRMLLFVSEDLTERWVFRQVFQSGSVSMDRKKGSDKTLIAVEFSVEKPRTGLRPFRAIYHNARAGDASPTTPTDPTNPTDPTDQTPDIVTATVGATV